MSELLKKLEEKEKKGTHYETVFWRPAEGEIIEGVVKEIGSTITEYGDSDYLDIETLDGQKFTIFLNGILKRLLEEENVKKGDRIAIKFLGYEQSTKHKNRKFKNYILVKDSDAQEDNPGDDEDEPIAEAF